MGEGLGVGLNSKEDKMSSGKLLIQWRLMCEDAMASCRTMTVFSASLNSLCGSIPESAAGMVQIELLMLDITNRFGHPPPSQKTQLHQGNYSSPPPTPQRKTTKMNWAFSVDFGFCQKNKGKGLENRKCSTDFYLRVYASTCTEIKKSIL